MTLDLSRQILLVDDDVHVRTSLAEALTAEGYQVKVAGDAKQAVDDISGSMPAIVLCDVRMPGEDGISLLRRIRRDWPDIDVVMITAYDDMQTVATSMREGAIDFIVKPVGVAHLRTIVDRVLADRSARFQARESVDPALPSSTVIGRHPAMLDVYKRIGQAARARANVLIRGESGTGKELVARAIHDSSARARDPFVAVNCAAVPGTLLESELFGHSRGAFTGAVASRRGCFAAAGSGTIFLDEIGDTTPEFQSKLLRVLQSREYQPVGSERVETTDARVIAATHQPLEELVKTGGFRTDLYYRLRVLEIHIPPLRDRVSDVSELAEHLAAQAAKSLGLPRPVLSKDASAALLRHSWPGNVRELENCIVRATALAAGTVIHLDHLGLAEPAHIETAPAASLAELERDHIARVLRSTEGHKGRAVAILGITLPRLNRLLRKYGLGSPQ